MAENSRSELARRLVGPQQRPTIWFASRGPHVVHLQRLLQAHNLYSLAEGDDAGLFGAATENALKAFQASRYMNPSGVCEEQTWLALIEGGDPQEMSP